MKKGFFIFLCLLAPYLVYPQENEINKLMHSADTSMNNEDFLHAMNFLTQAATQLEQTDSTNEKLALVYMKLALCFDYFDFTDYATSYLQTALNRFEQSGDKDNEAYCLTYLGDMFEDRGENTKGMQYQLLALQHFAPGNKKGMAVVYDNLSSIYENYHNYDSALLCLDKAIELYRSINNKAGECVVLNNYGDIWLKKGTPENAVKYYETSLKLSREIHNHEEERGNLKDLAHCYSLMHHYEEAYKLYNEFYEMHRKLKIEKKIEEIAFMQVHSIQSKKQLELENVQAEKQVATLRFTLIIVALVSGIIILLFIYFSYRAHAKKEQHIQELKEEKLRDELEQRKQNLLEYTRQLTERSELAESLKTQLDALLEKNEVKESLRYKAIVKLSNAVILTDEDWINFKKQFENVYEGFFVKLRDTYPDLSTGDIRLAALLKLRLSQDEISRMMGISVDGVKKAGSRLKKKLNLEEGVSLKDWVEGLYSV